jgi:glycine amidinotransferase
MLRNRPAVSDVSLVPSLAPMRADEPKSRAISPVSSHNEWDPLEEVIVGRLDGATIPGSHPVLTHSIPRAAAWALAFAGGLRQPKFIVKPAQRELDGFIALLKSLGITVRQPKPMDHRKKFGTPDWSTRGFCNMFPRDSLLVIGDEIIEAPMPWPARYFEVHSYRAILKDYFRRGARWTAAPKPQLTADLFVGRRGGFEPRPSNQTVLTEFEPVFDAANFVRCGRDLFVTRSNVTNAMGIDWLRRHLGGRYRIHEIESRTEMHIDTCFMPLAPGKVLVNPVYIAIDRLPEILKTWDVLIAPEPDPITDPLLRVLTMSSKWLSMNLLMVDPRHVIVDPHHTSLIRAMERWGFEPIPCPFTHYVVLGGAFHCATLDIRRRGGLESYF